MYQKVGCNFATHFNKAYRYKCNQEHWRVAPVQNQCFGILKILLIIIINQGIEAKYLINRFMYI